MKLPDSIQVLRNRDFRLYWAGQAVSLTGTWMQVMAQGWLVTGLSQSAAVLGALNVATTLPILLLSMIGGTLADRFEKRRILMVTQVGMMFLAFILAGLLFTGRIALWHIFTVATLLGLVTAFDLPAAQAFPPELVRRDEIPKAVALIQAVFHGSRLVGPAIAGVLIARFGDGSAFLANGLSFLAVIATLMMIPDRQRVPAGPLVPGRRGIGAGFRYVRSEPIVGRLMALTALTTTFVFPFIAILMVYYARHVLMSGAEGMGTLMSASGLGSLLGAITLLYGDSRTLRRWLFVGILGCGAGILGLSLTTHLQVAVSLVAIASFSVSSLMGRISQTIQHIVPNELRGRVMAVFTMAFTGIMPYASLALAGIADIIGFAHMLQGCAVLYSVLAFVVLARVRAPAPAAEPATAV